MNSFLTYIFPLLELLNFLASWELSLSSMENCRTIAQLGYFKGRGLVEEIGHKDMGFRIETFRAIAWYEYIFLCFQGSQAII